jgi:hypothetical protein
MLKIMNTTFKLTARGNVSFDPMGRGERHPDARPLHEYRSGTDASLVVENQTGELLIHEASDLQLYGAHAAVAAE